MARPCSRPPPADEDGLPLAADRRGRWCTSWTRRSPGAGALAEAPSTATIANTKAAAPAPAAKPIMGDIPHTLFLEGITMVLRSRHPNFSGSSSTYLPHLYPTSTSFVSSKIRGRTHTSSSCRGRVELAVFGSSGTLPVSRKTPSSSAPRLREETLEELS